MEQEYLIPPGGLIIWFRKNRIRYQIKFIMYHLKYNIVPVIVVSITLYGVERYGTNHGIITIATSYLYHQWE